MPDGFRITFLSRDPETGRTIEPRWVPTDQVEAEARHDWLDNRDLDDDTKLDLRRDAADDERDLAEREHDDEMRDADDAASDPR